jgi:hypothetical protein
MSHTPPKKTAFLSREGNFCTLLIFLVITYISCSVASSLMNGSLGIIYGLLSAYLICLGFVKLVRSTILKDNALGQACLNRQDFAAALEHYQRFYDLVTRHPFIDKYRYLFPNAGTSISLKEMALNNITVAQLHLNGWDAAHKVIMETLREFPESAPAKEALLEYESIKRSIESKRDGDSAPQA